MIQKGFFNVLLDDPVRVLMVFSVNKFMNFPHIFENFDASALIHRSWFNKPHIFCAMFERHPLFFGTSPGEFPKSLHEHRYCVVFDISCDHISGWCCVKNCIARFLCVNIFFIIVLERFNKTCFLADSLNDFKMVENKWFAAICNPRIHNIISA